jgi:protein required for attachment to host cells
MRILPHGAWLAICDGSKAMLLENTGEAEHPNLAMREVLTQDNPSTAEQGSAAPGRTFSSADGRRSAVAQTDFHDLAERQFLRRFAERIDLSVAEDSIHTLVLIAPPRALGVLRRVLTDRSHDVLCAELKRDYVKKPLHEIERLLCEDLQERSWT